METSHGFFVVEPIGPEETTIEPCLSDGVRGEDGSGPGAEVVRIGIDWSDGGFRWDDERVRGCGCAGHGEGIDFGRFGWKGYIYIYMYRLPRLRKAIDS